MSTEVNLHRGFALGSRSQVRPAPFLTSYQCVSRQLESQWRSSTRVDPRGFELRREFGGPRRLAFKLAFAALPRRDGAARQAGQVHVTIARMQDQGARSAARHEDFGRESGRGVRGRTARGRLAGGGLLVSIALATLLGSCSAIVDPVLPLQPMACNPNATNPCLCADGMDGLQRCEFDGSFGDCRNAAGIVCGRSVSANTGARGGD